jgi:pimeloyl-ACP methyl ester carboxylesterase
MSVIDRTPSLSRRQLLTAVGALSSIAVLSACTTPMLVIQSETTVPEPQGDSTMNERNTKPTIILVHGAFAESSSWDGVIQPLQAQGYTAIAAANPLRSLSGDADYVAGVVKSIEGPVVLVGHSYGGAVISQAAQGQENVKSLVYAAAFAPDEGENAIELAGRFPGSTLGDSLRPVPLADGSTDLYIQSDKFHHQFAADVADDKAVLMAATQRPVRDVALGEGLAGSPAWKAIPAWFVLAELDQNIPIALQRFMAERAQARERIEVKGASHAISVSHPQEVADMILRAAASVEHALHDAAVAVAG